MVARTEDSVERARDGGAAQVVATLEQLPELDGFVVATPTSTHADVLDAVLDRGVPTFVEKPMCDDPVRAAALAARAPDRLFVMDKWRYHPGVMKLAEIARGGDVGQLVGLRIRRVGWGVSHDDVDPVWVLAPHDLSIAIEILGMLPEPRAAVAERSASGIAGIHGLLGEQPWLSIEVSARAPAHRRLVELHGTLGSARLEDGWDEHVTVSVDTGGQLVTETVPTPGELPLLAELRAFVEHLRGGPPPRSSAAEGARVVEVLAQLRALAGFA